WGHYEKTVNLALQGGGAHGAFTWGALDRLLDEPRLGFEAITGTSAGAMNAAMVKTGAVDGGNAGARAQLDAYWGEIRRQSVMNINPVRDWLKLFSPNAGAIAEMIYASPSFAAQEFLQRNFSPYDWNLLDINPLRDLLERLIDFDVVCRVCNPHLHICATNVRTGKIKVFADEELSVDVILASAALPFLFKAVEIDGEAYWDGGYMGNPALYPLVASDSRDILIVHVNPIERPDVPTSARDILNRVNEISFNATLLRELRAIDFVKRLIEEGHLTSSEKRDLLIHSIRNDQVMADLNVATKLSPEPELIDYLKSEGQQAADRFLTDHWGDLDERSTVDLRAMFQ
ncbi:MAG: patatin-like phospholipase family protein, partial [Pseudomonadota bacterium]